MLAQRNWPMLDLCLPNLQRWLGLVLIRPLALLSPDHGTASQAPQVSLPGGMLCSLHACNRLQRCAVRRSGTLLGLYRAGGALALCMALYSAGGIPGTPVRDIGAPGSMLIGPCVTGGKLGPATSKRAVVWLAVTTRGDACAPEINTPHSGIVDTISMVGARHVIMAGSSMKL